MSNETNYTSGSYRIEMLKGNNWMPWKRRMMAVLRDQQLDSYIETDAKPPVYADPAKPEDAEKEAIKKWREGDAKARTRIELAIGDSEMVHIIGATTASEMWKQLTLVKESRGRLGILTTRRALYRTIADEGFDLVEHVTKLRKLQEELHLMGSIVADEDFAMILVSSLPESWDIYTSAYLGTKTDGTALTSHELYAILLDEDRRRKGRNGQSQDVAMQGRTSYHGNPNARGRTRPTSDATDKECFNCHRKGHMSRDCWSKGGGKEGQGPRSRKRGGGGDRANQASDIVNNVLTDVAYAAGSRTISSHEWVLDSATTSHICNQRNAFTDYTPLSNATVQGLGSKPALAEGRGTVYVNFAVNDGSVRHRLMDALFVPEAPNSLLSVSRFDETGGRIEFQDGTCKLYSRKDQLIGSGKKLDRLYVLDATNVAQPIERANLTKPPKPSWDQWHRRYGHLGMTGLETLMKKGLVKGLEIDPTSVPSRTCEACIQAKQTVLPFPKEAENRSKIPGERTMCDVWGPARTESIGKSRYYISFLDDATRTGNPQFMRLKSDATKLIKNHIAMLERNGRMPRFIRFDNGKELVNKEIEKWAAEKGITIETTSPYSPSQHGAVERLNRTYLELARAMLIAKGLPPFLWAEAVAHAAYIRNRSPTKALDGKTPYEAWHGTKPDVSHFREFGCDAWVLHQGTKQSKLAPKSAKMKFLGFLDKSHSIRFYDPATRSIRESRNVAFNENNSPSEPSMITILPGLRIEGESEDRVDPKTSIDDTPAHHQEDDDDAPEAQPPRRSSRNANRLDYRQLHNPKAKPNNRATESSVPEELHDPNPSTAIAIAYISAQTDSQNTGEDPRNLNAAKRTPQWENWKTAINEELETLNQMRTWELVDLPKDREPIGNRWTFVTKRDEKGEIARYKARLVAQGFSQQPGVDYSDNGTFAPVTRFETFRTVLAIATIQDWELCQIDVKGAYLNGIIKEDVYMKQPQGFEDGTGRVCRLLKTIYGLKQSGYEWNQQFNGKVVDFGYTRLRNDYCAYIHRDKDDISIIVLWVDDILAAANNRAMIERLVTNLKKHYTIKIMGEPTLMLGIHISRDRAKRTIRLSQTHYVKDMLQKYGMTNANGVSTPMDPNVNLYIDDEGKDEKRDVDEDSPGNYATKIGSLLYAAHSTRPDILYAVVTLAQFTKNPLAIHHTAVKRVFRYLIKTMDNGLTYEMRDQERPTEITYFTDSDWASNAHRKSISGYVFTLGGGAVAWSSKKQSTTALSSAEAEYVASTHATKQLLWQRSLMIELHLPQPDPQVLQGDNQASISIAHNPEFHSRTKHIDIALHFLRDHVESGIMDFRYVSTKDNLADIMTKPLARPTHETLTRAIGLLSGQGGVLGATNIDRACGHGQ
jgi:hypothetical protein